MKIIYYIILFSFFGCETKNINYDKYKIEKKYQSNYKFFLDEKEINFPNVYLNKYNIKKTIVNRRNKKVIFNQINKSKQVRLNDYDLNTLVDNSFKLNDFNCENCILVIEGVIFTIDKINDLYFEEYSIEKILFLKEASFDKSVILISLKK